MGSVEFSKLLLQEGRVAVSPGIGFGEYGEGFCEVCPWLKTTRASNRPFRESKKALK